MTAKSESDADAAASGAQGSTGTHGTTGSHSVDSDVSRLLDHADIGIDEAHSNAAYSATRMWQANEKWVFDQMAGAAVENAGRNRDHFDAMMTDARNHVQAINQLVIDRLANSNTFSHGETQRSMRHGDIAADRMWNVDEVAAAIAKNAVFQDAIVAAMVTAAAAKSK